MATGISENTPIDYEELSVLENYNEKLDIIYKHLYKNKSTKHVTD